MQVLFGNVWQSAPHLDLNRSTCWCNELMLLRSMYLASALPKSSFGKQIDVLSLRICWNVDSGNPLGSHIAVAFAFAMCECKLIIELGLGVLLPMDHVDICPRVQTDAVLRKGFINSRSRDSRHICVASSLGTGFATLGVAAFAAFAAFATAFGAAVPGIFASLATLARRRSFLLLAFLVLIPSVFVLGIISSTRCSAILTVVVCLPTIDAPFLRERKPRMSEVTRNASGTGTSLGPIVTWFCPHRGGSRRLNSVGHNRSSRVCTRLLLLRLPSRRRLLLLSLHSSCPLLVSILYLGLPKFLILS